jgi:predicted transcriptional regulator of viral defense system
MLSRNIEKLQDLGRNDFFTIDDVAQSFGLQRGSARVFCSRYAKQGLLVRLRNNLYTTASKWENLARNDYFAIANILQVPSYISLMTALAYYDVTTQAQQDYQESICLKRTIAYNVRQAVFSYVKMQRSYYSGFVKTPGFFIATKEKAFMDATYLYSFGKYRFDIDSLDLKKLDFNKLKTMVKNYPQKTKDMVKRLCGI